MDPATAYWSAAVVWGLACWAAAFGAAGLSPLFPAPHTLAPIEIGLRALAYGTLVWLAVAFLHVPGLESPILAATIVLALAIIETDARRLLIPDIATLGLILVAMVAAVFGLGASLPDRFAGAALGLGMFWTVRVVFARRIGREALGWGDVKLAGAMGASVGLWAFPTALLIACAVTAAMFVIQRGRSVHNGAPVAPLGVGLALAIIVMPLIEILAAR